MSDIKLPKPYRFKDFIEAIQNDPDDSYDKRYPPQTIRVKKGLKK